MACPACRRRSALIAALAPAISRLPNLTRHSLLGLLALPDAQLPRAAKVKDPDGLRRQVSRRLELPRSAHDTRTRDPHAAQNPHGAPGAICRHDPGYPHALAQLPSAPAVLHATCPAERLRELLKEPSVAIVGDRRPTRYAHRIAFTLAHDLAAAGITVISAVNSGLEGTAHDGALHAHGRTIAVMPASPEHPYLRQHEPLHQRILERGAAISEFPPGFHPPQRWCFIAAQRIIAALAGVVVVIEARKGSPALLTTQIATDLGHDVAVVPGRVTDPGGQGTFALLRDGAHPIACAQDVLELIYGAGGTPGGGVRETGARTERPLTATSPH
jgi:DNA processing protein